MRKHFFIPVLAGMLARGAVQAFAQAAGGPATVVMRNGDRVRVDVRAMGADFTFRVDGQLRRVPIGDVVLLDFTGDSRNVTREEVNKVNAAKGGYVVMKNGETFNASLKDLTGDPLIAHFTNGRRANLSEVARVYTGLVSNVPGFPTQQAANPRSAAPANARTVVVPSNVQWTTAGFEVSRGQYLRFEPSGEIRLSTNGDDMGRAAGAVNGRTAVHATIPSIPVGVLIGRVGSGQPFAIGDTTNAIGMPANGRLFFGVNDDHVQDNSGNYVVKVWEP